MKFRRKSAEAPVEVTPDDGSDDLATDEVAPVDAATGPWDIDDVDDLDAVERVDLGSLVLTPIDGLEVRLQVDESSDRVQSVLHAGPEGAVELRAFAAPRNGDLWDEVRPRIAAEYAQRGGTATEREGRYGTELDCQITVRTEDGRTATQPSRVIGINGPRWMLRATFLGRPAVEPETVGPWDTAVEATVVRRGAQAMPVGAELPLTMPPRDRLVRRGS
ncbi:DUF3710 domain-containing protein [Nocardioides sp. YIM 152315]|uniref:DUF3710 domain-containing protein n=1 Tax=Nocardioides sp. YIM 152315 TaxID=3031760 RepID=UPI0023D98C1E|nr:DUF3710 domain-containing protein [Nocardioides sp. YIM 152315]MDF1603200.1 DUF3710 domain-containing protein [Nocardioides sp. YIM 152315]